MEINPSTIAQPVLVTKLHEDVKLNIIHEYTGKDSEIRSFSMRYQRWH